MTNLKKKLQKRWGKKFIDKRNWPECNERLVKRGEYLLDFDFVREGWRNELEKMNKNKRGRPFEFPNSLIELQAVWHAKSVPYRMIEGVTRSVCRLAQVPDYNDYTTANRRVNKLDLKLELPAGDKLGLFCDGTGLQVVEGGEYLRDRYGKKNRRWIQVVLWGDPKTKEPVSFDVKLVQSSELEAGRKQLEDLVRKKKLPIEAAGGDGSFDDIGFWRWLEEHGIKPLIKPDRNARDDSGSFTRNFAVLYRNKYGHEAWSQMSGYGFRWPATEGIISATKRMFGEQIHARTEIGMLQEARIKFWAYQRLKRYGDA